MALIRMHASERLHFMSRFLGRVAINTVAVAAVLTALAWLSPARADVNAAQQRTLIDSVIARFPAADGTESPTRAGRVVFLGFAGFGEERVFAEEIKMAARQVGDRFGSTQRSLLLINDRRDLTTYPLATHDNLRYALKALAAVMDIERDILFLALSSHGSQNGMISVSNTGMPEVGLSAQTVARFINEAGIRWKVIVVSACFSGTFIEPLADNHTIVITAASRNRMSFGCSDDRHLTYFGEAFYRDALPSARTLRGAFEATRIAIRRREKEERVTPSQPQSYFGPLIESFMVPEVMVPGGESGESGESGASGDSAASWRRAPSVVAPATSMWAVSHR
jgi:hypothetical protein